MPLARFRIIALFIAVATVTGYGFQTQQAWPPGVRSVPADAPGAVAGRRAEDLHMPPGYRIELVASEPLVQDPIVMDWDAEGRLWVVEMPGFVQDLATARAELRSDRHASWSSRTPTATARWTSARSSPTA